MSPLTTAEQFLECLGKSQFVEEMALAGFLDSLDAGEDRTLSPEQLANRHTAIDC